MNLYFNHHLCGQKMRLHVQYWKAPLFFVGNSGQATGKPTEEREGGKIRTQDTHKYSSSSSISSLSNSILCMFPFFISIISSMMDIFQSSGSFI